MKITKQDHKRYFVEKGDPGFNPAWNKTVINGTIKKYETKRERIQKDFEDKLGERSNALAWYFKSKAIDTGKTPEDYFGRKTLAMLRGEQIVEKIKFMGKPTFTQRDIIDVEPVTDMRKVNAKKKQKSKKKA